jgi:tetraacyldisaccharide 4'-kinase
MLLETTDCNIVLSDDGLQHYALKRDVEIVMIDGERQFGNQQLLPAGPLREPLSRLKKADFFILNGKTSTQPFYFSISLLQKNCIALTNKNEKRPLTYFQNKPVYAVAGIGNPQRFFSVLKKAGLQIIEQPFPDHHLFNAQDFVEMKKGFILMTEKDAVKCREFADERFWYVPVTLEVQAAFEKTLLQKLDEERGI